MRHRRSRPSLLGRLCHCDRREGSSVRRRVAHRSIDIAGGTAAAVAGGLIGAWVMEYVQRSLEEAIDVHRRRIAVASTAPHRDDALDPAGHVEADLDPDIARAPQPLPPTVASTVRPREIPIKPMVDLHPIASTAAVYGMVAEIVPAVTLGAGVPFWTAFWVVSDEVANPPAHRTLRPVREDPTPHTVSLVGHVVLGVVVETVRRLLRGRR